MSGFDNIWLEAKLAQRRYYGYEPVLDDAMTSQLLQACMVECAEALQSIPSHKAWSRGDRVTNRADLLNELADIQLFVLAIAHWQGLSQDDFMQIVADKQAYNTKRNDHKKDD